MPQGDADRSVLRSALERYERTATTGSLTFSSVSGMTAALDAVVPQWIGAGSQADKERRQKMVALFVLDLAWAEFRSPAPYGRHRAEMLEWACRLLRRERATEFGRIWMLASVSLLQPMGSRFGDVTAYERDHLGHARKLFPEDSRLRLAELLQRPAAVNLSNRPGGSAFKLSRSPAGRVALARQLNVPAYTLDLTLRI